MYPAPVRPRRALLLFLFLSALHTWPLASAPWRLSLNHNADAELNAWMLSWIAHTLPRDPLGLFDTNIFAPEPTTLTYTDPLIVPALAAAPAWWLTGSPVLAFNVSLMVGLALTGWATWLLARHWTGSSGAALVAGALAAFNPHLLTRLPHTAASWMWTLPLTLYLADRLLERRDRTTAGLLALTVAATAATSLYTLVFASILIGLVMFVAFVRRQWGGAVWVGGAAIGGVVLAAPVLVPYARFAATGVSRPLASVEQFSATIGGYLHSSSRLHAGWSASFFDRDVSVFFAGFTALALSMVAVVAARRWRGGRHLPVLLLLAVVGVVLSLGPATPIYTWLYDWALPLRGLRAAARFGYLYLLAVAIAAAIGAAWLLSRLRSSRAQTALTCGLVALVTVEAWSGPIATTPFAGVPPIYRQLHDLPDPVNLVEVPFWPAEAAFQNGEYVINATAHWRPLLNGYSGFLPQSYRDRAPYYWYFPEPRALDRLAVDGVTHVMVHIERWPPHERPALEQALREQTTLSLIATDTRGHRLYKVN